MCFHLISFATLSGASYISSLLGDAVLFYYYTLHSILYAPSHNDKEYCHLVAGVVI